MKPDWKDAPDWANYLAMDDDGIWVWYDERPRFATESGRWVSEGQEYTPRNPGEASKSLQERP